MIHQANGSNQTSWSIRETGRVMYEYFPLNFLSSVANLFIIFLCFKSEQLKHLNHSKYFIAHTAFFDMAYSVSMFTAGAIFSICYSYDIEITANGCTLFIALTYFFGTGSILSNTATIYCRYREVKMENSCRIGLILVMLFFPYMVQLPTVLPNFWLFADSERNWSRFCKYNFSSQFMPFSTLLSTLTFSICVLCQMSLSLKLYKHLNNHFKNVCANLQTNRSELDRLKTEKSILTAVFIQGFAPVVLTIPSAIKILFSVFYGILGDDPLFYIGTYTVTGRMIVLFVHCLNPLIDSWVVLFVMIPYVKARRKFVESIRSNRAVALLRRTVENICKKMFARNGNRIQEIALSQFLLSWLFST